MSIFKSKCKVISNGKEYSIVSISYKLRFDEEFMGEFNNYDEADDWCDSQEIEDSL